MLQTLWLESNEEVRTKEWPHSPRPWTTPERKACQCCPPSAFPAAAGHRVGVEALAHALLKNSPRLKEVDLYGVDDGGRMQQMVDDIVITAGSRHRVRIDINASMVRVK